MAGVSPFMPVIAKGLGINAAAFGLVYTVIPFCVFLSKPFFGYLTDYFQNIKAIVFLLVFFTASSFVSILIIPQVATTPSDPLSTDYNLSCSEEEALSRYKECYGGNDFLKTQSCPFNASSRVTVSDNCTVTKLNNIESCLCDESPSLPNIYSTYQFWVFSVLAVVSGTGSATVYCLTDTACYEVVKDHPGLYGRQRVWATISWGVITSLAGFLNDLATPPNAETNYSPGFYIMLTLVIIDLLLLLKIQLAKPEFSLSICRDVGKIFASPETVIFAIGVYIVGALTSLIWSYEFWYLEDLGASSTLLGLAVGVQCLVAEIPMFFFSGWFIKHLGYFYCLIASFAAFTVRFLLYSFLKNPWLVLPVEVTQGFSYALFYASMTGYASTHAPPGTEATMMGILGGLFEGLGVATGSFLGGIGFNKLGGRHTFLAAAVVSFVCVPVLLTARFLLRKCTVSSTEDEKRSIDATTQKRYDVEPPHT
uniref:Major facilitator superfamily domain-containing protein 6 n=1 Tax=Parasteatoda tepidariorum TaxID=114398 RepID=A0A2L2XYS2_PARTP